MHDLDACISHLADFLSGASDQSERNSVGQRLISALEDYIGVTIKGKLEGSKKEENTNHGMLLIQYTYDNCSHVQIIDRG